MTESGIPDARTEDTDRDPGRKKDVEIGVDPETDQRNLVGSGATLGTAGAADTKKVSETELEIGGIGNGAGVERSTITDRGEVSAAPLKLSFIVTSVNVDNGSD